MRKFTLALLLLLLTPFVAQAQGGGVQSGVAQRVVRYATPPTCNSSNRGGIYLDTDDNKIYYCNGTAWTEIGSGSSIAATSDDTQVLFNSSDVITGSANLVWNNSTNVLTITGTVSGATNLIYTSPSSNQTIQPTADSTFIIKQANVANTADIFNVTLKSGTIAFAVDKDGTWRSDITGPVAIEGSVGACSVAAAGKLKLCANTGNTWQYSYNGGAYAALGGGITSLGSQTGATQTFATGTTGTDFNISSATDTHTFNIPDASATARGLMTTGTQTIAGAKTFSGAMSIGAQLTLTPASSVISTDTTSDNLTIRTLNTSGSITGLLLLNGGDTTGTSANSGGNATSRGGDATGASGNNIGGNYTIRPGIPTSATGVPGKLIVAHAALDGGTITSGALQCVAADSSVADCATSATNFLGIALATANPMQIQSAPGLNSVAMPYDVTSAGRCNGTNCTPVVGDFVCSSANTAGQVQVQSTACAAGRQVGIIFVAGSAITSAPAGSIFLQFK